MYIMLILENLSNMYSQKTLTYKNYI